jgi:pimeloyl-ACP methyl ester carboxylesterase
LSYFFIDTKITLETRARCVITHMVYICCVHLMKLERNIKTVNQSTVPCGLPFYAQYGVADGHPVMAFHGTPGSSLERIFTHSSLRESNIRLIVVERPGYGRSRFDAAHTLLDWSEAVERLADSLEIERFSVAGFSGGGPYAAACAYRFPQRLFHTALISSPAPYTVPGITDDMLPGNLALFEQARDDYQVVAQQIDSLVETPQSLYALFEDPASLPDRKVLADQQFHDMYLANLTESVIQGMHGMAYDMALLASHWGFEPEQIKGSVSVWHGEQDVFVPVEMGRYLATTIPDCQQYIFPDQGHFLTAAYQALILQILSGVD